MRCAPLESSSPRGQDARTDRSDGPTRGTPGANPTPTTLALHPRLAAFGIYPREW